jgi:hypothetical protein
MCADSVVLEWTESKRIEMKNVVLTFNGEHVGGITQVEREAIDEVYPCIETLVSITPKARRPTLVIKDSL